MYSTSAESPARTQLRKTLASIEQQLESLAQQPVPEGTQRSVAELRTSWSALVKLLALGPEPEVRVCPTCKHTVMRVASLCGYCWTKLEPLAAQSTPDASSRSDEARSADHAS